MTNDRKSTAAALLAGGPAPAASAQSRNAVVTRPVRVTVEFQQGEYDNLGAFCRRAKQESGAGSDVAKSHVLRVLAQLAQDDPAIAERVFEALLTEGPTRHRS